MIIQQGMDKNDDKPNVLIITAKADEIHLDSKKKWKLEFILADTQL